MIDLHTHTEYSDGSYTVREVLKEATKNGVTILSITDHDKVDAHLELKNKDMSDIYNGRIITGAEFSASFNGIRIELLGYNIDIHEVKKWLDEMYSREKSEDENIKEFKSLYKLSLSKGITLTEDLGYDPKNYPVDEIYYDIKRYQENMEFFTEDEWNNIDVFWRKCSSDPNFIIYWDFSVRVPDAKEVSKIIRDAGGKVFLAHLYKYKVDNYENLLDNLRDEKIIDGVEVYYSTFSDDQIGCLEKYCRENNLFMSAGSDFHGWKKPERRVGKGFGNMDVPETVIKPWVNLTKKQS